MLFSRRKHQAKQEELSAEIDKIRHDTDKAMNATTKQAKTATRKARRLNQALDQHLGIAERLFYGLGGKHEH